ncbi:MAG: pterin-4-alpha-carbinolamine dehydratase [Omnitrophica bacterium RIFCSPHIGHO2_02_FULL_46_11]|nr:MAG: pterin-4-alpha-carbinolamine dehydratase [Omnitrophica bacterium RIFCSPHIGHO2_02_FULL_46_11]OGW87889.1 MAG: pterin-4-alpha-carbinolamine dehydratase [Omnitrophica bacterium RIFCSPLOWO2_01_FULL_45_10b]
MAASSAHELTKKKCKPCAQGALPFSLAQAKEAVRQIPGWILANDGKSISREFAMKNFLAAVHLIGLIAEVAEGEDHHPDLHLTGYRKLRIELATHSIGGLSENDFILAAKIDELPKELKKSA